MQSLIDQQENKRMVDRIQKLTPETKPIWGKMNAAQMLAHTHRAMKVALGDEKMKLSFMGLIFGKIAKKQVLSPKPFGKNLPTAPQFVMKVEQDFNKERTGLLDLIERVKRQGFDSFTKEAHPFFGKMTAEQWDYLQHKHLDHHLSQFGI
jgi:hypothetical protein